MAFQLTFAPAMADPLGLRAFAALRRGPRDANWRWEPAPPRQPAPGPPRLPPPAIAAVVAALALLIGSITIVALNSGSGGRRDAGQPEVTEAPRAVEEQSEIPPATPSRPAAAAAPTPTATAAPRVFVRDAGSSGPPEADGGIPAAGAATAPGGSGSSNPVSGPAPAPSGITTPAAQPNVTPKGTPVATPTPSVASPPFATSPVTPPPAPVPAGTPPTPRPAAARTPVLTPTPTATPPPHRGPGQPDDEDDSSGCGHGRQSGDDAEEHARSGAAHCGDDIKE